MHEFQPKEIRKYQGIKLSSIADFKEMSIRGPQHIDRESYRLKIAGLVENPIIYRYDEVINQYPLYRKVATLPCGEGWGVTLLWQGILVSELIKAPCPLPAAGTVIFHGYDGYTTASPVDYIVSKNILLAYKMNGCTIPTERGFPFQLVAEGKLGYKSAYVTD